MRAALWALVLSAALCVPAYGDLAEDFGASKAREALPEDAAAIAGESLDADLESGLARLWDAARDRAAGLLGELLRPAVGVLAVAAVASAAEGLCGKGSGFDYVNLTACLAVSAVSLGDVKSVLTLGRETLGAVSDFSRVLLPSLSTAAIAAGAVSSAPAKYAATLLFLDVLMDAANTLLLPLLGGYLAAVLAEAALGEGRLGGAVKLLKWACKIALTALVTAFTLYLGITGVVAGSADAVATKAAKTALSAALPVVGSILSDAAGSLVAGAGMVRGAVGVFGLLAVLALCLTPVLALGLRYLLFKAAGALASVIGGERLGKLIDGIGGFFGMLLGLVGAQAVFLFVAIISMMKAVGG